MKKDKLYTVNPHNREAFAKYLKKDKNIFWPGGQIPGDISASDALTDYLGNGSRSAAFNNAYKHYISRMPILMEGLPGGDIPNPFYYKGIEGANSKIPWLKTEAGQKAAGTAASIAASILSPIAYGGLSRGYTSGAGKVMSNLAPAVGAAVSMIPGLGVFAGPAATLLTSAAAGGVNHLIGTKRNEENINALNTNVSDQRIAGNALAAASTTDSLREAAKLAKSDLAFNTTGDLVKTGILRRGKGIRESQKLLNRQLASSAYQDNGFLLGSNRVNKFQGDNAWLNSAAYGGPLYGMGNVDPSTAIGYDILKNDQMARQDKVAAQGSTLISPFAGVSGNMFGDNLMARGGNIHIKKANEGKFTEQAKRAGMSVQQFAAHVLANKGKYSAATVKRANFARNASKWHAYGGQLSEGNLFSLGGPDERFLPYINKRYHNNLSTITIDGKKYPIDKLLNVDLYNGLIKVGYTGPEGNYAEEWIRPAEDFWANTTDVSEPSSDANLINLRSIQNTVDNMADGIKEVGDKVSLPPTFGGGIGAGIKNANLDLNSAMDFVPIVGGVNRLARGEYVEALMDFATDALGPYKYAAKPLKTLFTASKMFKNGKTAKAFIKGAGDPFTKDLSEAYRAADKFRAMAKDAKAIEDANHDIKLLKDIESNKEFQDLLFNNYFVSPTIKSIAPVINSVSSSNNIYGYKNTTDYLIKRLTSNPYAEGGYMNEDDYAVEQQPQQVQQTNGKTHPLNYYLKDIYIANNEERPTDRRYLTKEQVSGLRNMIRQNASEEVMKDTIHKMVQMNYSKDVDAGRINPDAMSTTATVNSPLVDTTNQETTSNGSQFYPQEGRQGYQENAEEEVQDKYEVGDVVDVSEEEAARLKAEGYKFKILEK